MTKGKSTWKYNKLLTGRKNYFDGLSGSSILQSQPNWYTPAGIGGYVSSSIAQPNITGLAPKVDLKPALATTPKVNNPSGGGFLGLDWGNPFNGVNGGDIKNAAIGAAGAAIGNIGGGLLSGGMSSGAGNLISGLGSIAGAIPGPWGAAASAGLGLLGGLTNRMFGSKLNKENIAKVEANINNLNSFQSNASDFDTLASNWANADVGMTFDKVLTRD